MSYKILRTDKANEDIRKIIFNVAYVSQNKDIALKLLDKFEESINMLKDFPYMGIVPQYTILKKQKFRVLIIDKYLVFYKVNDNNKQVIIYHIILGKRNYLHMIG